MLLVDQGINDFYRDLKRRAHYLQIINDLALGLLQQSSMDDILWLVAKSTIAQLGFLDCVIYLVDAEGSVLIQRAAHGPKNPVAKEILNPIAIPIGEGIVGSVAATGKPELVKDTRLDGRYILDDEARLSEMAVPIFFENKVIGVIDSEHPDACFYTEEHLEIMTTIASMAATKIASALAIERLQETVAELHKTQDELRHHATHDPLTGLYNRRVFETHLDQALAEAHDRHTSSVLGYLDLDLFKVINDTSGHMAGDDLLRHFAKLLTLNIQPPDIVARLGGDEFGLLLHDCDLDTARERIGTLHRRIEHSRFEWLDKSLSISVSIGLCQIDDRCPGHDAAMTMADTACLIAKESGRNRIHVYQETDVDIRQHYLETHWIHRLERAIEQDRFRLYCQPIVPIRSSDRATASHEILLRMIDENGRLVMPSDFLPAVERFGIATRLDRYVFTRVLECLARNRAYMPPSFMVSINISATSLGRPDFRDHIVSELQRTGIPGSAICIEITETAAIANYNRSVAFIRQLKQSGCRFAIDDFGSGMTTVNYLRRLPVEFIKLDGELIERISEDPIDRLLIETIVRIAHMLDVSTVAEHVDSDLTLQLLREMGIDHAQGYWLGRPVPLETLMRNAAP